MSSPILATKLYLPPLRPKIVHRTPLIQQLNEGLHRKLTLISAPAGFGKTTLVSQWIATVERPVAWLSLGEADGEWSRFLAYFVAALRTISAEIGADTLTMLQSPQPQTNESILTVLLNEIATISEHFILVLDDYHVIDAQAVDEALTYLLDYLPPQMHLVITTREDPPLPLARYRVRSQLTELRASDLRFTAAESADFLNQVMGLKLSADDVAKLESRTEGWIAGLQLAAISMQGRTDTDSFIRAFAGSHHFVLDYLIEEVLGSQPDAVRQFLLQTSILSRLSASLCDAVTDAHNSKTMLEELERGNLFVVPLDDQRQWVRYHHLFADVLQARLLEQQPEQVATLHQRASAWYQQNGFSADAIHHAFAAHDFELAANLIELVWRSMDASLQLTAWIKWAKRLPVELVRVRPVLSMGYAWALFDCGELEAAERWLEEAERAAKSAEIIVNDQAEFRAFPITIASAHAYIAQALGDVPATIRYAQQALDLIPADEYLSRGIPSALLGLAYLSCGELAQAHTRMVDSMSYFERSGNVVLAITGTFSIADIEMTQGRLRAAMATYQRAIALVNAQGDVILGAADLYLGLGELYYEQGDDERAREHFQRAQAIATQPWHHAQRIYEYRSRLIQARVEQEQQAFDAALKLLAEADVLMAQLHIPDMRPIAARKARVWIAAGRLGDALNWARESGLSIGDELSYMREYEHVTLARLRLAQFQDSRKEHWLEEALQLLGRLLESAENGNRMGSVIEILLLQTLAYQYQANMAQSQATLANALTIAEPEGYVRTFSAEGQPIANLLTALHDQSQAYFGNSADQMKDYCRKLLVTFPNQRQPADPAPAQTLVDPLSEREQDVLRLLNTDLTGPQIANALSVSLNTMRTHTKNIYSKLNVSSRRMAVRRAQELNLL